MIRKKTNNYCNIASIWMYLKTYCISQELMVTHSRTIGHHLKVRHNNVRMACRNRSVHTVLCICAFKYLSPLSVCKYAYTHRFRFYRQRCCFLFFNFSVTDRKNIWSVYCIILGVYCVHNNNTQKLLCYVTLISNYILRIFKFKKKLQLLGENWAYLIKCALLLYTKLHRVQNSDGDKNFGYSHT